jgi:pyroglutamyl-peptidase
MAKQLLVTAFKPYENYARNVSAEVQLALTERRWLDREATGAELMKLDPLGDFAAGLYDVDFDRITEYLDEDLTPEIGAVLLMGQAPGRATIDLERFAINAGARPGSDGEWFPLEVGAPDALQSDLPLDDWTRRLKEQGFPVRQSFHAGTYLCNASLYYALRRFQQRGLPRAAAFLHLPLATELFPEAAVSLPMETILRAADATVRMAMEWIDERQRLGDAKRLA